MELERLKETATKFHDLFQILKYYGDSLAVNDYEDDFEKFTNRLRILAPMFELYVYEHTCPAILRKNIGNVIRRVNLFIDMIGRDQFLQDDENYGIRILPKIFTIMENAETLVSTEIPPVYEPATDNSTVGQ